MADTSIFMDKTIVPTDNDLIENIGSTHDYYDYWKELQNLIMKLYPAGIEEWT